MSILDFVLWYLNSKWLFRKRSNSVSLIKVRMCILNMLTIFVWSLKTLLYINIKYPVLIAYLNQMFWLDFAIRYKHTDVRKDELTEPKCRKDLLFKKIRNWYLLLPFFLSARIYPTTLPWPILLNPLPLPLN